MEKNYNDLGSYLKKEFRTKIIKLSLDGDFTCPNRDGSISRYGCLFCSERGSGEFSGKKSDPIPIQIEKQKKFLSKKWNHGKYIAYFGTFTSTYKSVIKLKQIYDSALSCADVVGLAIATRPDSISKEILELLKEYNKKTYLWIELGLQTTKDSTHSLLNTGYNLETFKKTYNLLKENNIKCVVHVIANIINETKEDFFDTITFINNIKPWGLKIHMLYIVFDSPLYNYYIKNPYRLYTMEEYVSIATKAIRMLHKDIVIHRLTGDPPRKTLYAPSWTINKRKVYQAIEKRLKDEYNSQGDLYTNTGD